MKGQGLTITRGDTLRFQMQAASGENPISLAGFSIRGFVRAEFQGVIHEFTPAVADDPPGVIEIHIPAAVTATFPIGETPLEVAIRFIAPTGDRFTSPRFFLVLTREADE